MLRLRAMHCPQSQLPLLPLPRCRRVVYVCLSGNTSLAGVFNLQPWKQFAWSFPHDTILISRHGFDPRTMEVGPFGPN